jgi:hypothetical protein
MQPSSPTSEAQPGSQERPDRAERSESRSGALDGWAERSNLASRAGDPPRGFTYDHPRRARISAVQNRAKSVRWFVASMVVLHKARLTNGAPPALRWVLALTLGLGIGLLFAMPGTAWGISGYASGGSAVGAQYPDSGTALPPKPVLSDLAEVRQAIRGLRRTAQWQATQRALVQALSSGVGLGLGQTGSIALLIAAIAVVLVGGVLRWRRDHVQSE